MTERADCPPWCTVAHDEADRTDTHMTLFDVTPARWVAASMPPEAADHPPQVLLHDTGHKTVFFTPEQAQGLGGMLAEVKRCPEVRALSEALQAAAAVLLPTD